MTEFGVGMFADIFFQLLPKSFVIADFFTGRADGDKAPQHLYIPKSVLQLFVASTELSFSRFAAVHFLF
jgi:hypothetical protein